MAKWKYEDKYRRTLKGQIYHLKIKIREAYKALSRKHLKIFMLEKQLSSMEQKLGHNRKK